MSERVLISIATMNSRERLRECLASLPDACGSLSWTATVVDNCSTDGTEEMVERDFAHVTLIKNAAPRGFGANHNQVLQTLLTHEDQASHVLVLNGDTRME